VLDLSKGSRLDLIALEIANQHSPDTQLDLSCLRNVVRLMTWFGNMNDLADKVKIVVNRVGLGTGKSRPRRPRDDGQKIYWQLPNH